MQTTMITNSGSFGCYLGEWLGGAGTERVKPSSRAAYGSIAQAHLLPELGALAVAELDKSRVTSLMQDKAGQLSPATLRSIAAVLRGALRCAELDGAVSPGCAAAVQVAAAPKRREARALTREEQTSLEHVLCADIDRSRAGVLLALYTGLRVGELCALQWRDVSASRTLTVRRTVQRIRRMEPDGPRTELLFDTPKSATSARTIPIPAKVHALLEPLRADDACFVLSGTEAVVEPRTMQNRFKAYLREAGVPDYNFHALRHTFATRWVERGFDVKALSRILGHADVATTLNIYVHPSMDTMRDFMDQL